jgi:hypothetical protein
MKAAIYARAERGTIGSQIEALRAHVDAVGDELTGRVPRRRSLRSALGWRLAALPGLLGVRFPVGVISCLELLDPRFNRLACLRAGSANRIVSSLTGMGGSF